MVDDALSRVLQDTNSSVSPAHIRTVDIAIVPATNTASMDSSSSSCNSQTEQMVSDLLHNVVEDALNRVVQPSERSNPASSGLFYEIHRVFVFFNKFLARGLKCTETQF